jgi:hypothetical protein
MGGVLESTPANALSMNPLCSMYPYPVSARVGETHSTTIFGPLAAGATAARITCPNRES